MKFSLLELFSYQFMINAVFAGLLTSITAGILGYFVIIRGYTFSSHAISHIGIPGATGAVLLGISPIFGLATFCILGGLMISLLGKKISTREVATGSILAFATALGLYFASLSSKASKTMQSVLFGNILAIDKQSLLLFTALTILVVVVMLFIGRPLLFASITPVVAQVKGVRVRLLNIVFILLLSLATTMSIQVVGTLLLFALLITPTSTAINLTARPIHIILLSIFISSLCVICGIIGSAVLDIPPSFAIVAVSVCFWLLSKIRRNIL
jgi:zinc/manganese transport system permease protein